MIGYNTTVENQIKAVSNLVDGRLHLSIESNMTAHGWGVALMVANVQFTNA